MRNLFHDINDILLAVVIVLIAALIIAWRFNVILDYPAKIAEENASHAELQDTYNPEEFDDLDEDEVEDAEPEADEADEAKSEDKTKTEDKKDTKAKKTKKNTESKKATDKQQADSEPTEEEVSKANG